MHSSEGSVPQAVIMESNRMLIHEQMSIKKKKKMHGYMKKTFFF